MSGKEKIMEGGDDGVARSAEYLSVRREVLRDLHGSAGLPQGRISLEVLYLLPDSFVDAYVKLFWEALAEVGSGGAGKGSGEANVVASGVSSDRRGHGGRDGHGSLQSRGGGKKYKNTWLLRNEKALAVKETVDAELVKLARTMALELKLEQEKNRGGKVRKKGSGESSGEGSAKRCEAAGCGRFNGAKSNFCSNCGTKLS